MYINGPHAELKDTEVYSNTAGNAGGGIFNGDVIQSSTIHHNTAGNAGGGIFNGDVIQSSTIHHNDAVSDGGGIQSNAVDTVDAELRVEMSLIAENHADSAGGGVFGGLTLVESTVRDNTAQRGAGLDLLDSTISKSLIVGNQATDEGGGVAVAAVYERGPVVNIENSTISGNKADRNAGISHGGPVFNLCETNGRNTFFQWGYGGAMKLTNTTVAANDARSGVGGINVNVENRDGESVSASECPNGYVSLYGFEVVTEIVNTVVAANNGDNCANIGAGISKGHNLSDDATCLFTSPGDIAKTPAKLGPLQDNGGPTLTHALLDGSPAIDAGDDSTCPATDQRGTARPRGPHCDIGAYELVASTPTVRSNHLKGAPGSYFTVRAEGFPPSAQAKIQVNGVEIGVGKTDADGGLQVELDTREADKGLYAVTVQVNPSATVTIRLDPEAPMRAKQDSGPQLTIPAGIGLSGGIFLPLVVR